MKHQILVLASTLVMSANALAFDLGSFLNESHEYGANYEYAEGSLLFHPDDFKGFELRGSHVFRPNVALTGVFNRLSADLGSTDVTSTEVGIGARYFFGLQDVENTDLDLSAALVNYKSKVGSLSASDTALLLGAQVRHLLGKPVGGSDLIFEEAYVGAQLGFSSEDSSAALHAGLLVAINSQFSARTEVLIDDGAHLSIGVRMKLGRPQRNPEEQMGSQSRPPKKTMQPVIQPAVVSAPVPSVNANPHGLTKEEMADLKAATD